MNSQRALGHGRPTHTLRYKGQPAISWKQPNTLPKYFNVFGGLGLHCDYLHKTFPRISFVAFGVSGFVNPNQDVMSFHRRINPQTPRRVKPINSATSCRTSLRTEPVETCRIIRPLRIAEIRRAAGESDGLNWLPCRVVQIRAGFHHNNKIASSVDVEPKLIVLHTEASIVLRLRVP